MYVIVWKYEVRPDRVEEFEAIYGSRGQWAELFSLGAGYLGTTLSRETGPLLIYLTFDYWRSEEDFRQFSLDFRDAYRTLDLQCAPLTSHQQQIGAFRAEDQPDRGIS